MQTVIDLPEDVIEGAKSSPNYYPSYRFEQIWRAIVNGVPLPKGHGKLIDADVLCDYFWDNRNKLYTHKDLQIVIDNAPTIIEADKAESENE